jgi:hypothetical protein
LRPPVRLWAGFQRRNPARTLLTVDIQRSMLTVETKPVQPPPPLTSWDQGFLISS